MDQTAWASLGENRKARAVSPDRSDGLDRVSSLGGKDCSYGFTSTYLTDSWRPRHMSLLIDLIEKAERVKLRKAVHALLSRAYGFAIVQHTDAAVYGFITDATGREWSILLLPAL